MYSSPSYLITFLFIFQKIESTAKKNCTCSPNAPSTNSLHIHMYVYLFALLSIKMDLALSVILYSILKQAKYFFDPTFLSTYKNMSAPVLDKTPMEKQIYIFSLQFIFCHFLWNKFQIIFYPHSIRSGSDFTSQQVSVITLLEQHHITQINATLLSEVLPLFSFQNITLQRLTLAEFVFNFVDCLILVFFLDMLKKKLF